MRIIVPDNPLYGETLANIPHWWRLLQKEKCSPINLIQNKYGLWEPFSNSDFRKLRLSGEFESILQSDEEIISGLAYSEIEKEHELV